MSPTVRAGRMAPVITERPRTALTSAWWLPGLTTAERRSPGPNPDWAEFVESAIARAEAPEPAGDWRRALASVFGPLVEGVRDRVGQAAGGLPGIDLPPVTDEIALELASRLATLAARALVFELNLARQSGILTGETPEERFADFIRRSGSADGLAGLFTTYPVLARLLGQACLQAADAAVETLERFTRDRDAIIDEFGHTGLGTLVRLSGGAGDAHAGGRSVRVLEFSCGRRLVYKPRPLDLHLRFTDVVRWINTRLPELALRPVDALARPGYGWLRFVSPAPCESLDDVDRFYRRQGVLLALLYTLDATDVHFENLIARGDQPVLVDVETLFQPIFGPAGDPAGDVLSRSVQRTMLLPQLMIGEHGALDLSGLTGRGGQTPDDQVGWADPGTDRMRLIRSPGELPGKLNMPSLDGADVEPAEHSAALLGGFRAGYDVLSTGREELARLLRLGGDDPIRVLLRPTDFYARLLDETTHPDLLRDAEARDEAFSLLESDLADDPALLALVPGERADLWAGDVPLFSSRPGATAVWDSRGRRFENVVTEPPLAAALAKLAAMTTVDRRDQEWLISAALAAGTAQAGHRGTVTLADAEPAQAPDSARLLAAACGIADQILARAFTHGDRANWLGLELIEERHWAVMPMSAGLGEGYCGVALFLAQLAELTGIARYRDLAVRAVEPLPALFAKLREDPGLAAAAGCGGLLGLGGVAYATTRLTTLLDLDATLVEQAVEVMPPPDADARLTSGAAGGLTAMRSVHAETGLDAADQLARKYRESLLSPDATTSERGFARGTAGIAWALGAGLPDGEHLGAPSGTDLGWCGGLAGTLLAYAQVNPGSEAVDDAVAALATQPPLKDLSLCHGESGVTEALCSLAVIGHTGAASAVQRRAGRLLAALDRHGARCGTPGAVPTPGLLTGLAGIGYGLLRLGFTARVPSALLLQPGTPAPDA